MLPVNSPTSQARRARGSRATGLLIVLGLLSVVLIWPRLWYGPARTRPPAGVEGPKGVGGVDVSDYVKGPPTMRFRDNLRPDVKYITSWTCGGWTNDVIAVVHTLYLALLTERVPIIGQFSPQSHIPHSAGNIAFGDIFDLPRLANALHIPILEWRDVKAVNSTREESIGCWSSWMGGSESNEEPRDSWSPGVLHLDVSYTPVPREFKSYGEGDLHLLFSALMELAFPTGRTAVLRDNSPLPSSNLGVILAPDEHVLCFDWLYYSAVRRSFEWEFDWSPQWRLVARHMRWAPELLGLAEEYLKKHLGTAEDGSVAPYIAVHARRDDFKDQCPNRGDDHCLPSFKELKDGIRDVQDALLRRNGTWVHRVLVMSDERDEDWWNEIAANGWMRIDHAAERTAERHGLWYETLLDAVFQSRGVGFVGTDGSTMSLVAERRVRDWNGGQTAWLKDRV